MIRKILICLSIWISLASPSWAGETTPKFYEANKAYKGGDYKLAIDIYEKFIREGSVSGPLLYNLGNSYFKSGQLGKAIGYYEWATRFIPRDGDLKANYQYALAQRKFQESPPQSFWDKIWNRHVQFYTIREMVWIVTVLFVLGGILYLLGLCWPGLRRWINAGLILVLILELIYGYGMTVKMKIEENVGVAVKTVEARFEPKENATVHFALNEGAIVKILQEESGWVKLKRPDDKAGWVPQQSVMEIK